MLTFKFDFEINIRPKDSATSEINEELAGTEDPSVTEYLSFTLCPGNLQLKFFPRVDFE
jgi:hypothetical protein